MKVNLCGSGYIFNGDPTKVFKSLYVIDENNEDGSTSYSGDLIEVIDLREKTLHPKEFSDMLSEQTRTKIVSTIKNIIMGNKEYTVPALKNTIKGDRNNTRYFIAMIISIITLGLVRLNDGFTRNMIMDKGVYTTGNIHFVEFKTKDKFNEIDVDDVLIVTDKLIPYEVS